MPPWYQIILTASLFTFKPLFITLNIAFVCPPLAHVSNDILYLQFQSHSYNTEQQSSLSPNAPSAQLNGQEEGGCTGGEKEGTVEAEQQADFISVPRLLLLKAEVQRVVGNFRIFH